MTNIEDAGQQFNCKECGKPQFTAEFGFEKHNHSEVKDPCIWCGDSTASGYEGEVNPNKPETVKKLAKNIGLINPKFINRTYSWTEDEDGKPIEGWACADCMGDTCPKCNKTVRLDEDVQDEYGNKYHEDCLPEDKRWR